MMDAGAYGRSIEAWALPPVGGAWLRPAVIGAVFCIAYVTLDWASAVHEWSTLKFSLWNPTPALAIAMVAIFGFVYAPFVFVAALLSGYLLGSAHGLALAVGTAAILAAGYGWLGAIARWFMCIDLWRAELKDLVALLLAAALGAGFVAIALVSLHAATGQVGADVFLRRAGEIWISDATGILSVLPVLLLVAADRERWRQRLRESRLDLAVFLAALTAAGTIVFFVDAADEFRFFYLLFVPVIWLAIRRRIFGGTLAVLLTQIAIVISVVVRDYPLWTFLSLQMLMLILGSTGLLMGAAVSAWHRAHQQIRRQQADMDRAARVTAIGTMGSALAHEISQPLASISTYARACQLLLGKDRSEPERLSATLDKIVAETERAGAVLRNMRDSVAAEKGGQEFLNLEPILQTVIEQVRREPLGADVRITLATGALRRVWGNRVHVEQVVLNVLRNAVEATARFAGSGTVAVVAAQRDDHVEISVADQGPGVDEEVAATLFEPFITTKPHGLGLGLAISRSLVQLAGGDIAFRNLPQGGAKFSITFP